MSHAISAPNPDAELKVDLQKRGRLSDLSWIDTPEGPKHAPQWISMCKSGFTLFIPALAKLTVPTRQFEMWYGQLGQDQRKT